MAARRMADYVLMKLGRSNLEAPTAPPKPAAPKQAAVATAASAAVATAKLAIPIVAINNAVELTTASTFNCAWSKGPPSSSTALYSVHHLLQRPPPFTASTTLYSILKYLYSVATKNAVELTTPATAAAVPKPPFPTPAVAKPAAVPEVPKPATAAAVPKSAIAVPKPAAAVYTTANSTAKSASDFSVVGRKNPPAVPAKEEAKPPSSVIIIGTQFPPSYSLDPVPKRPKKRAVPARKINVRFKPAPLQAHLDSLARDRETRIKKLNDKRRAAEAKVLADQEARCRFAAEVSRVEVKSKKVKVAAQMTDSLTV
ncbi:hypothetical protein T492DRAFT_847106 [Pavlovales sp. CCMP2436]|nr:hypothetical protein T492DRAFT_847106 [Pavlovales sp. CCMP2436]